MNQPTASSMIEGGAQFAGAKAVAIVAGVIAFLVFLIPMFPYAQEPGDISLHIDYAKSIHSWSDVTSPHFFLQLVLIGAHEFFELTYEDATVLLMGACYGLMGAVIAFRIYQKTPSRSASFIVITTIGVLIASHIFVQTLLRLNFMYGYIAPVVYHNPTQVLCKLFAVTAIYAYFSVSLESRSSVYLKVMLIASVVLSAISKPSFLIAFLPAVLLFETWKSVRLRSMAAVVPVSLVAVPAALLLGAQFVLSFKSAGSALGFAPFLVYGGASEVLSKLPGSVFFPFVAATVIYAKKKFTPELCFAWLLYFIGMFISICVVETGPRLMHGNFAWTGQSVTFILYVETVITLSRFEPKTMLVPWLALVAHVLFGLVWFFAPYFLSIGTYW